MMDTSWLTCDETHVVLVMVMNLIKGETAAWSVVRARNHFIVVIASCRSGAAHALSKRLTRHELFVSYNVPL